LLIDVLNEHPDTLSYFDVVPGRVDTQDAYLSGGGFEEPEEMKEQSGLAASVRPQDHHTLPFTDYKIKPVEVKGCPVGIDISEVTYSD
jgi:hypothetical protein